MTFNQAFKIALNNEEFKKHVDRVKTNLEAGKDSGCLLFAINDEAFSYGSRCFGKDAGINEGDTVSMYDVEFEFVE